MKYSQVQQWNRMLPLKYKKIWDLTIKYSTRFCYNLWSLCASRFMGSLIISSSESQRDLCLFLNNEFLMFYRKKIFFSKFLIGIEFIQQIVFFQFFSIQHNNIHTCMYIIWWCRYFNKHTSYCTCIVKSVYSHCTKSVCSCLEICDWGLGGGGSIYGYIQ